MASLDSLAVEHYTAERIPNPYSGGELPWQVYHEVRNAVVQARRRHGPTGPLGIRRIDVGHSKSITNWERGDEHPVYWVMDDQYNHERYLYVEFQSGSGITAAWLEDITDTLARYAGWGIGIPGLAESYLLIFADRLMVQGPGFRGCRTAQDVMASARRLV